MSKRKVPVVGNPRVDGITHVEAPGLAEARNALRKTRRKPDEADAPRLQTFPGRAPKPLPGSEKLW